MKSILSTVVAASATLLAASHAPAQTPSMPMAAAPMASQAAQGQAAMTEGEVRKVDLAARKLTLRHGDIRNLGMPGMTMVFKVTDPKMLSGVKEGDKVRFTAERLDGALTVTSIVPAGN